VKAAIPDGQVRFVQSLTQKERQRWLDERQEITLPSEVQFVCVVGTGSGYGDGIVSLRSQWPEDLQRQGVPAVLLRAWHRKAVRKEDGAQLIAEAARMDQPRWDAGRVRQMRERLWGKNAVEP
jgi:hypothetical protein